MLPPGPLAQPRHLQLKRLILRTIMKRMNNLRQLLHPLGHIDHAGLPAIGLFGIDGQFLHFGPRGLTAPSGGGSEVFVGDARGFDHVEGVLLGGGVVGGDEGGGSEGAEGAVEGEVVDVGGDAVREGFGGDFGAVCFIVIDSLVPRPIHNLPSIANKPRNRHAAVLIHRVNPPPRRRRHQHLILQRLFHREDDAVTASQSERRPGILDGFGGVFYLEDAAVGGEG
mmetsp:Transcript_5/g.15  ORF Transcript_5/g.15 Transcript_5/m.15 type:complete len:225 (-) Transcript_5:164-838(-)